MHLYIPIWFYFNSNAHSDFQIYRSLYIPIWFYFNPVTNDQAKNILVFTFQYGSTLIGNTSGGSTIIANFTFQYGSTLIGVGNKLTKDDLTLHSNMVLL